MRVILLGHRGFVGSAIARYLQSIQVEYIGIDRSNFDLHKGQPAEVVINADGSSDRGLARTDPLASFRVNVDTTMQSVLGFPCERYILISTVAVYNDGTDPSRNDESVEIDPVALSPYGFFKRMSELVVMTYTRRWLVLRLGPLVGFGLRKNSIFDLVVRGTLLFHPDSTLPYIDTRLVARIAWDLRDETNEVFNVCGRGVVRLADVARELGVALHPDLNRLPVDRFSVNIDKIARRFEIPDSMSAVLNFVREWGVGVRQNVEAE